VRAPKPREVGIAATAVGAWLLRLAADHRAINADSAHEELNAPLRGQALAVSTGDGTPLHVMAFGSPDAAATVVLVHGWTCALSIWTRQIRALAGDDVRVVAYDLRGHGRSARPDPADYSIDAHAEDLDAVLHSVLARGQRAIVAGHSLGGMTIVRWAGRHPEAVARLVAGAALVNTAMDGLIAQSPILRSPRHLARARGALLGLALGSALPLPKGPTPLSYRVVRWVALSSTATPAEIAFCERIVLDCSRDVRARCGDTLSALDIRTSIASLDVPTAIIGSEHDRLTAISHVRRLADALPHVTEEIVIPGGGHMSIVTDADVVTGAIRRLIDLDG